MDKRFYITTPIYYPSAKPHMGHAYSSIIADFFARFKRMDGFEVQFLTGTDEHGLKIQRSAEKQNIDPLEFCNQISQTFRDLSKTLNLTNTDFIRTTEERHKKTVQHLWNELEKNDDICIRGVIRGLCCEAVVNFICCFDNATFRIITKITVIKIIV